MSPINEPPPKHIPAWKKLGLKLKFAKEISENATVGQKDAINGTLQRGKRKNLAESDFAAGTASSMPPAKKTKRSKIKTDTCTEGINGTAHSAVGDGTIEASPSAPINPPARKRKSVSFTTETKAEDGDSVKKIYKTWLASQIASDPSFDPSMLSPALKSITPPVVLPTTPSLSAQTSTSTSPAPVKKPKKPQHTKPQAKSSPGSSIPDGNHPALNYLAAFHTDPNNWKFSKPLQNHLLKHLFSLPHIASSHDPALLSYLRGLQGIKARSRIRKDALANRAEDEKWLDEGSMENETDGQNKARRRKEYEAAVKHMKARLQKKWQEKEDWEWDNQGGAEKWRQRLEKRRRAELVLWSVGEEEEEEEAAKAGVETPTATPPTQKEMHHGPAAPSKVFLGEQTPAGPKKVEFGHGGLVMEPKKTVFGDGAASTAVRSSGNTNQPVNTPPVARQKKKRKRKRRTGGVPDDESSSSDSSSSSSDESAKEANPAVNKRQKKVSVAEMEEQSDSETSSSSSSSSSSASD